MADDLLDYGRRLGKLHDELSGGSVVLLGFPGVAGGYLPNVIPPPLLFYSPAVLLLHDTLLIPDHVFDLDTDDTLATAPYRLLDTLAKEGLVRFVPCDAESALHHVAGDIRKEAARLTTSLLADSPLGHLPRAEVSRAVLENDYPAAWPPAQRSVLRNVHRAAYDAIFLHGLAEILQCPYSFANNDFSVHAARHQACNRDLESMVVCALQLPAADFSIVLDDRGQSADLLPESILIPQRTTNWTITVRERGGDERPVRAPDQRRSMEALDRVLSLRVREPFSELRKILHEWRTGVDAHAGNPQKLEPLGQRCQENINPLLPLFRSALAGLGQPGSAASIIVQEPQLSTLINRLRPGETGLPLSHVQQYGDTPALSSACVMRPER